MKRRLIRWLLPVIAAGGLLAVLATGPASAAVTHPAHPAKALAGSCNESNSTPIIWDGHDGPYLYAINGDYYLETSGDATEFCAISIQKATPYGTGEMLEQAGTTYCLTWNQDADLYDEYSCVGAAAQYWGYFEAGVSGGVEYYALDNFYNGELLTSNGNGIAPNAQPEGAGTLQWFSFAVWAGTSQI